MSSLQWLNFAKMTITLLLLGIFGYNAYLGMVLFTSGQMIISSGSKYQEELETPQLTFCYKHPFKIPKFDTQLEAYMANTFDWNVSLAEVTFAGDATLDPLPLDYRLETMFTAAKGRCYSLTLNETMNADGGLKMVFNGTVPVEIYLMEPGANLEIGRAHV